MSVPETPVGTTRRNCSLGVYSSIEGGLDLGAIITVQATTPFLVWAADGSGWFSEAYSVTVPVLSGATIPLIPTDMAGWLIDGLSVDVTGGKQSHAYNITIQPCIFDALGRPIPVRQPVELVNVIVPSGGSTLDLDLSSTWEGPTGVTVTVPLDMVDLAAETARAEAAEGLRLQLWAPSTAYNANDRVAGPDGTILTRHASGTSRSTFDSTEKALWDVVATKTGTVEQAALSGTYALTQDQTVHTTAFTAAANTIHTLNSTSSSVAVALPTAPADKVRVVLKDIATVPLGATFTCGGSDVINKPSGSTSGTLKLAAQAVTLQYDATRAIWVIISDDMPLGSLDGRFIQPAGKTTTGAAAPAPRINVKDYGALGDGSTDDHAAINAAAAAAQAAFLPLYFPPGTYTVSTPAPNYDGISLTGPIPEIFGSHATIKLINNNPGPSGSGWGASTGNYHALISAYGYDISDTHIHHLTFDGNNRNAGNTVMDKNFVGGSGNTPRTAISFTAGARVKVTDCRFTDFDSTWLVTTAGSTLPGSGSVISDVVIQRNVADNIGSTITHDHSSLYIDADGMTISDNVFRAKTGLSPRPGGARTAIETHGPNQSVYGNHIYGYQNGSFTCAQSTSVASSYLSGSWHDNFFIGVGIGIQLRTASTGSTYTISDFSCHDNKIVTDVGMWHSFDDQQWGSAGITLLSSDNSPIADVSIHRNQIRMTDMPGTGVSSADNQSAGIFWQRTNSVTTAVDKGIVIEHNVVDGAGINGVYFTGAPSGTQRLSISDNKIVNPGQLVSSAGLASVYAAGIYLPSIVTDGSFHRNKWIDNQGTHTMTSGLNVAGPSGSARLSAYHNEIYIADGTFGTSVSYIIAPTTSGVGVDMQGSAPVMVGNTITGNFAASSQLRITGNGNMYVWPAAGTVGALTRIGIKSDVKGTIAAQAGAGTSPPAPAWTGRDLVGNVAWGTGTSPAAGAQVALTFGSGAVAAVAVVLIPKNSATAALQPYVSATSSSGFTISTVNAPAASQSGTTYACDFMAEYLT